MDFVVLSVCMQEALFCISLNDLSANWNIKEYSFISQKRFISAHCSVSYLTQICIFPTNFFFLPVLLLVCPRATKWLRLSTLFHILKLTETHDWLLSLWLTRERENNSSSESHNIHSLYLDWNILIINQYSHRHPDEKHLILYIFSKLSQNSRKWAHILANFGHLTCSFLWTARLWRKCHVISVAAMSWWGAWPLHRWLQQYFALFTFFFHFIILCNFF